MSMKHSVCFTLVAILSQDRPFFNWSSASWEFRSDMATLSEGFHDKWCKGTQTRERGERDICTVLMGLPIYRATFQYAKREYKIIFEVSRSHFHSIFQRMTLYIILGRAYFEISKHTWNSGASLMLRENQNNPCNVQNILKIFFRKHISVLPV